MTAGCTGRENNGQPGALTGEPRSLQESANEGLTGTEFLGQVLSHVVNTSTCLPQLSAWVPYPAATPDNSFLFMQIMVGSGDGPRDRVSAVHVGALDCDKHGNMLSSLSH